MSQPLISVITVCYNSQKTIRSTLEGMLAQTYQNYEYYIIDGASKDDTLAVVDEYRERFGTRLHVISEPDKGIYDAMNKGIALSKGELVGIVNSDDWYEPEALQIMADAYDPALPYQILYGIMRTIKNDMELDVHLNGHKNLPETMITHPTCFVSRTVYNDFGVYDCQYRCAADYDFMLRMFYNKKVTFVPLYKVITNFRWGGMSSGDISVYDATDIRFKYGIITAKQRRNTYIFHKIKSLLGRG